MSDPGRPPGIPDAAWERWLSRQKHAPGRGPGRQDPMPMPWSAAVRDLEAAREACQQARTELAALLSLLDADDAPDAGTLRALRAQAAAADATLARADDACAILLTRADALR